MFINWIMVCVSIPSYSLKVNGEILGFFKDERGLRQGDPISPFLFVICMEYLSKSLNCACLHNDFNFHPKCERLKISHLAFADNLMIFTRGDYMSVQIICDVLMAFSEALGLKTNSLKSSIFLARLNDFDRNAIIDLTGFTVGSMPFRYLGVLLSGVYLKIANYAPLIDKVSKTLLTWVGLNLSYAGRLEVISLVVQEIESFWLGVVSVSATVLDRITSLCRRFLWGRNSARVAWSTMCLNKKQGGLGLGDTRRWNDALLSKAL